MKKILLFIGILIPWFLSSLLPIDYNYYKSINLPSFAPPSIFYIIAWTIIYIFISISIYQILNKYKIKDLPSSYKATLIVNYLFNQSFQLVFFILKNNFLGFISCLGTFISVLYLYSETKNLNEKSTKYLVPYILLSIFASILSLSIYLLNL
ncbi:MAG: tryptophan-rich sensory protein [Firmicutes bacterium]|nr:tryptophan-rich sensory protein [Bacillota bacterium]